jgi:hypothetical protein
MKRFPAGSEWRKWDLHVHLPSRQMSNSFTTADGEIDWDQFCSIIEASDVAAFGLTDYVNLDAFFAFQEEFQARHQDSAKIFFPVVELRLNEAVNGAREDVNFHILFRPDETKARISSFLNTLKTERTDPTGRRLSCLDLTTKALLESATVTRLEIDTAYESVFGKGPRADHVLRIVPSNNDGIRADKASHRKRNLADQIDKAADLIFGNGSNSDWFLQKERYEAGAGPSRPKPVVTGSDAHNFQDLIAWLGRSAPTPNEKFVTWIKGDLTFEGLQQTLVEPDERVAICDSKPNFKEPYRYIEKIVFDDPDFPTEVLFNANLSSIIGNRSSGKSALLAYVAHAVDPEYTIDQQAAVSPKSKRSELGPAAGYTWDAVNSVKRRVVWGNPEATTGQVIYVPQNSLYEISTRPNEITGKIRPALLRAYPSLEKNFSSFEEECETNRSSSISSINAWFSHTGTARDRVKDLAKLGDKAAIVGAIKDIGGEIADVRKASSLTDEESTAYADATGTIAGNSESVRELDAELEGLNDYVVASDPSGAPSSDRIAVSIDTVPAAGAVGEELGLAIAALVQSVAVQASTQLRGLIVERHSKLTSERQALVGSNEALLATSAPLFSRFKDLAATEDLERRLAVYQETLSSILSEEKQIAAEQDAAAQALKTLQALIGARIKIYNNLEEGFREKYRGLDSMEFGLEAGTPPEHLEGLAQGFNKQAVSEYLTADRQRVDIEKITGSPIEFLQALESGTQKIRQGEDAKDLAARVLTSIPQVRLTATLEGDQVGGFATPTMTPGKQALFALTLTLSESDEPWPLLLDQPEDDLDSRSIYEVIVPYLTERKRERQVIMVSHNANLVVGADSESVIVANRHGHDRKNRDDRRFDYKSGSLEHSQPLRPKAAVLDSRGISEHSCEILDGGTDAFEKRKNKYNIKWA